MGLGHSSQVITADSEKFLFYFNVCFCSDPLSFRGAFWCYFIRDLKDLKSNEEKSLENVFYKGWILVKKHVVFAQSDTLVQ